MPKRKNNKNQQPCVKMKHQPSPQEQIDTHLVGDPQQSFYVEQNTQTFNKYLPEQHFEQIINDKIEELQKKCDYIKRLFPQLNLETVQLLPEEIFDQDDLRLFKSINSMLSPQVPLTLSRKLLIKDFPITELLDDFNLYTALMEIQLQFEQALSDEPFYYPFCCFFTQLWFQDAIEYAISTNIINQDFEKIIITNINDFFPKKFEIIQSLLNGNTYKLNKQDSEYLRCKTINLQQKQKNDNLIFEKIIDKVKKQCIEFNLIMRKNEYKFNQIEEINQFSEENYQQQKQQLVQNFQSEKNRIATIQKQMIQLKLRRLKNHMNTRKNVKKGINKPSSIRKLVENNQFYIGKKIDYMMDQLIKEEDSLIPPPLIPSKINQIQQGIISLINQQSDDDLSFSERYQYIKEKNNNKLKRNTSPQEAKIILEKKILKQTMIQQGLKWTLTNNNRHQKKDIREIIKKRRISKAKQMMQANSNQDQCEGGNNTIDKSESTIQDISIKSDSIQQNNNNQNLKRKTKKKISIKKLIQSQLQDDISFEDFCKDIPSTSIQHFIQQKINQRLNESVSTQDTDVIVTNEESKDMELPKLNEQLNEIPINTIRKLIEEQETKRLFLYNLMTRIEQYNYMRNEIFIILIKNYPIKTEALTQLININSQLEEKYNQQIQTYLGKNSQSYLNQIQFLSLIKKRKDIPNGNYRSGINHQTH